MREALISNFNSWNICNFQAQYRQRVLSSQQYRQRHRKDSCNHVQRCSISQCGKKTTTKAVASQYQVWYAPAYFTTEHASTPGSVINHGFIKRSSTRIWPGPCRHHKSFMSVFTRAKQTLWTRCTIITRWRDRKPQTPNRVNSIPIVTRIRSRASPLSTSSLAPLTSLLITS